MRKINYFPHYPLVSVVVDLINSYFASVGMEGNAHRNRRGRICKPPDPPEGKPAIKPSRGRPSAKKYDQPTITGLALHMGFDTLEEFERYENVGKFGLHLTRARLLVAAAYEKKLHNTNAAGAIFMLKSMGYGQEKTREKPTQKLTQKIPTTLQVEIIESGPKPAASEKEVILT